MQRIARVVVVLFFVSLVTMLLMDLVPGDPAYVILGETASPEQVAVVHAELGLDKNLLERYVNWAGGIVRGDLGTDVRTSQPVADLIRERLPVTLELAVLSLAIALIVSIPLGIITARRAGGAIDTAWSFGSSLLIATPYFVSALVLSYLLAVRWGVFPVTGWTPLTEDVGQNLRHALLPCVALAMYEIPVFSRVLRADLTATLRQDFVVAAEARGLSTPYIMFRHALRPSLFSLLTLSGLSLGRLLGGTVIVETIFSLPGLGSLLITSILAKSLIVVQGIVMFTAIVYVLVNALIDAGYGWLDPRVRRAVS